MNFSACATLPFTPENAIWYRAIDPNYLVSSALSSAHTQIGQTRFNPGDLQPRPDRFASLYFADNPSVAMYEIGATLGNPVLPGGSIPHPRLAHFTMLNVTVVLSKVADLSDTFVQTLLDTSAQELTGDWAGYGWRSHFSPVSAPKGMAPTQLLGQALFKAGFEGFRSISARVPYQKTLTVFTENLFAGSKLVFQNPAGTLVHHVP